MPHLNRIALVLGWMIAQALTASCSESLAAGSWKIPPGTIAYSHAGYTINQSKTAVAQDLPGKEFKLVKLADPKTRKAEKVALTREIKPVRGTLGQFQLMDFSDVVEPGMYLLKTEQVESKPFPIEHSAWFSRIPLLLEQFTKNRCNPDPKGGKALCHQPWELKHAGTTLIVKGGWHSSDHHTLSTYSQAVYSLLTLASRSAEDPTLQAQLFHEAAWGAQWLLDTRLPDGKRVQQVQWSSSTSESLPQIGEDPLPLLWAAAAEARAGTLLKPSSPAFAEQSLRTAVLDLQHALKLIGDKLDIETASVAILATGELFSATGEQDYATKSAELADFVVKCQQRSTMGPDKALFGFFYNSTNVPANLATGDAASVMPVVAMGKMCETFPRHFQWINWFSTLVVHAEHLKALSRLSEPFKVVPGSITKSPDSASGQTTALAVGSAFEAATQPGKSLETLQQVIAAGKTLALAGRLSHDPAASDLAHGHLQWVTGRNLFGTNYLGDILFKPALGRPSENLPGPLRHSSSGENALPTPAGPSSRWLHLSTRLLWLMADIATQPNVSGVVEPGGEVEFSDLGTGNRFKAQSERSNGRFFTRLPPGSYRAQFHQKDMELYLGAGSQHELNFTNYVSFKLSRERKDNKPILRVKADGEGKHSFTLLASNLKISSPHHTITFQLDISDQTDWPIEVINPKEPVVAVVFANGNPGNRREIFFWP